MQLSTGALVNENVLDTRSLTFVDASLEFRTMLAFNEKSLCHCTFPVMMECH
jgi:hypothetical protein